MKEEGASYCECRAAAQFKETPDCVTSLWGRGRLKGDVAEASDIQTTRPNQGRAPFDWEILPVPLIRQPIRRALFVAADTTCIQSSEAWRPILGESAPDPDEVRRLGVGHDGGSNRSWLRYQQRRQFPAGSHRLPGLAISRPLLPSCLLPYQRY